RVEVAKDGCRGKRGLELLESRFAVFGPFEGNVLTRKFCQGGDNAGIYKYKTKVEICKSQECSNIRNVRWCTSFFYHFDFLRIHRHTLRSDNKAEILHSGRMKLAFLR